METAHLSEQKRRLLERYLSGELRSAVVVPAITPRPPGEPAPLSLAQEQIWLRSRSASVATLYNETVTVRHSGPIEVDVLAKCLAEIMRRHEIWRTTYETVAGHPVQVVGTVPETLLQVSDLRSLPEQEREFETNRLACEDARRVIDLARGPLVRARLLQMSEEDQRLILTAHLSVVDGVSMYQIFPSELAQLYASFSSGSPSCLPELPVQFGDYAYWQRNQLTQEHLRYGLDYWRSRLAGNLPVLNWPNYKARPAEQSNRGAMHAFSLSENVSRRTRELAKSHGVTLFAALETAFAVLLKTYTSQTDIVIGTFSPAGRKRSEVKNLLGHFLNPVALRIDLTGDPTFREMMSRCKKATYEAISHDDLPIETIANDVGLPKDHPVFTVATSLQPTSAGASEWSVTSMDAESGGSFWDLYVAFIERPDRIIGRAQYNPDLFEDSTIISMIDDLESLLASAGTDPCIRLSELEFPHKSRNDG